MNHPGMTLCCSEEAAARVGNDKEMMKSFISSTGASYLQGRSCAREHVGLAAPVAIACLRIDGVSPQGVTSGSNPSFEIGDPMKKDNLLIPI
ncbi:hypothetical protein RJ639_046421 [Escallonia herrerae]|uniref:Uncharacterized protein n=1 Tax=Escallonia herrerae TaxID=1293975 RepID=A0AA89AZK6_9ASTE|nr:hypothetical protein RJ639_046421 [Escallonia herrerae]